jgi:DNA-binding response OmpR family regulator
MLILPSSDIAQLLANNAERQWILARFADLDQQDKEILTRAEGSGYVDVSMFPDETRRLLTEFLRAPKYMLSHEDIRTNVMLLRFAENPDANGSAAHGSTANGNALRQVIERARKNIKDQPDFHYEIRNIRGKGYQLVPCSKALS